MADVNTYRRIVKDVLRRYAVGGYANADITNEVVFDGENDRYLVVSVGWGIRPKGRIHGCLLHVDIVDGKVWIQRDGTEGGIADELEEAGIPKEEIVLGFHEPQVRKYTGYAAA
jgi:hypothetical protein